MSSLLFAGDATSYLEITNNGANDLALETSDFTIEWYQYENDSNPFPRPFQINNYPSANIGLSNEGTLYFWYSGSPSALSYDGNTVRNNWRHFAIVRASGIVNVYIDGVSVFNQSITENFIANANLVIGNESITSNGAAFGGYMYYFHWMKGFAKYTSDFTVTTALPTFDNTYTKLLVTYAGAQGPLAAGFINNNVTMASLVPPNTPNPPPPTPSDPIYNRFKSLFTNNSQVYYKPGNMGSTSGVGGVGNYRKKAKYT